MADDRSILHKIASFLPWPISEAVKESKSSKGRVEGTNPNPTKEEIAMGVAEPPKSEGKSQFQGVPRQKFYK